MRCNGFLLLGVAAGMCFAARADYVTNTWNSSVAPGGNAPTNAYLWTDAKNWKDTTKVPGYWGAAAYLGSPSTSPRFIRLGDENNPTRLTYASWGGNTYLLGNLYFGDRDDGSDYARADVTTATTIYGDFGVCNVKCVPYVSNFSVAGRYLDTHKPMAGRTPDTITSNSRGRTGTLTLRMDLWASSADPVREAPFLDAGFTLANAAFTFVGPRGADAQDSSWYLTAGSSYAKFSSSGNNGVVPGMVVTGVGVPTDGDPVFVKYVFEKTGWIELSAPATAAATGESTTLHFAAITPSVTQYIDTESGNSDGPHVICAYKFREQDGFTLAFRYVSSSYDSQNGRIWGLSPDQVKTQGYIPADIIISNVVHTTNKAKTLYAVNWLRNCRLEIPKVYADNEYLSWGCNGDNDSSRITVRAGDRGGFMRMKEIIGTIDKRGAGTFLMRLTAASNRGTVKVTEGTLELDALTTDTPEIAALEMAAGTTLSLPNRDIRVTSLKAAEGVRIVGPGKLRMALAQGADFSNMPFVLENGARLVLEGGFAGTRVTEKPVGNVVGHPAFWVDASNLSTITTNAAGEVTRWNDCRAGEPMFCTNIVYAPLLVQGETMAERYVKLRRRAPTYGWVSNTEALVWSVPIKDVRAVFMMNDPTDGGGDLLGRSGRLDDNYCGSQGGPFYRGGSNPWSKNILYFKYGTACVTNGWLYRNGELAADTTGVGYLGQFMQLTELHVNTAYWASSSKKELYVDSFGTSYRDGGLKNGSSYFIDSENGHQRIAECIIYTNTLTYAERAQVAQYLMQKWLGKDVAYQEFDPRYDPLASGTIAATNVTVEVAAGDTRMVTTVTGSCGLEKTGDGLLYIDALPDGRIAVEGGEVVVESLSLKATDVPGTPWVHFDAATASTILKDVQGGVTNWCDVSGNGFSARPLVENAPKATVTQPAALNGRSVVDMGALANDGTKAASFCIYKPDGSTYNHGSNCAGYIDSDYITSAYFFAGSKNGGGSLLGAYKDGYPTQGLPRDSASADTPILSVEGTYKNMANLFKFTNGTSKAYCNGVAINPLTGKFSGGYDVFSFTSIDKRKSDTFATYGQSAGKVGGLEYGEILVYTNTLAATEDTRLNAYLMKRWLDVDTPMYTVAQPTSLYVAEGAKIEVRPGEIETAGLGGSGTISGSVALKAAGVFEVTVDVNGNVGSPLTIGGTLTLPTVGSVVLAGDATKLVPGEYAIAQATSIVGDVSQWTAARPRPNRPTHVEVRGNALVLVVQAAGMQIFVL